MNLETFFEKFELFADAPDAVAKMRELVLELAVQGKLVEVNVSQGGGHSLLKTLRTLPPEQNSKSRVTKEIVVEPETQLEIPSHWALTTVENTTRETGFFCDGDWVESKDQDPDGEVRLIQLADIGDGEYRNRSSRFMTTAAAKRLNCSYLEPGDILIARMPDPLGRCCRFPGDSKPSVTVVDICILRPNLTFFDPDFLVVAINCPQFRRLVSMQATGTTRSRISRTNLGALPIPLPPLAEQKRIVAKVDELMALCDRLEAQQQEREAQASQLARASLARFAEAPTPANLPFLFHSSFSIPPSDLRKSILTLAVQGKLVPQDPNDEPAEDMLTKIEVQKKRLNGGGELKADKKAWLNSAANPPHELPESWCWVRLQDVFEISRGGSPRPAGDPRYFGGTIPWITVGEVTKDSGKYLTQTATGLTEEGAKRSRFINPGDLLLTNSGATLGVPKVSKIRGCMNDGVAVLRQFHSFDLNDFGYLYLTQQTTAFRDVNQGMGQPNLNTPIIAGWFFPIPPLAEQRRIVAKVEQLMALVDALETQLAASRATAANLLAAIVAELTAS